MKRILTLIKKEVCQNTVLNITSIIDYTIKEDRRDVYIDGSVYTENKIDLIFLVDTGYWFNRTIRFDIAINDSDNKIVLRKGYGYDYIVYEPTEFKKAISYINNELLMFSVEDVSDNKINFLKKKVV